MTWQITLLLTACGLAVPVAALAWQIYTRWESRRTSVIVTAELIPPEPGGALAEVEVRVLNDSDHKVYLQRAEIWPGDVLEGRPWRLLRPSEGSVPVESRGQWRHCGDSNEIGLDLTKSMLARVMLEESAGRFRRNRPRTFESKLDPLLGGSRH